MGNFENWTDGTRVYDKRDGQEGTIRGELRPYAQIFNVEMDVENRDSFGMRVGGFRVARNDGHWVEIATEEDSKNARKIRSTVAARAAIYAYKQAIGMELNKDIETLDEDDQRALVSDLLTDLQHFSDTFEIDFEAALGSASENYAEEV